MLLITPLRRYVGKQPMNVLFVNKIVISRKTGLTHRYCGKQDLNLFYEALFHYQNLISVKSAGTNPIVSYSELELQILLNFANFLERGLEGSKLMKG